MSFELRYLNRPELFSLHDARAAWRRPCSAAPSLTRHGHYWFVEGGRRSAAIVRIGIAVSLLLVLVRLSTLSTVELPGPAALYHPVGPWRALGHFVPPDVVVVALWGIAWVATIAMLVGFASRIATVASFGAAVALASLSYASQATWSHSYNVVFLAQLAFLGAHGGDTFSIDALIRKLRGSPPRYAPRGYQWSLRLVQLAVALMFASAASHKLLGGHFTLRWALSDNLRNQLLVRYDLAGLPRSAVASWLVDAVWRYRIAALLNLVSQSLPILACIFVDRPRLRAICGLVFATETVALGLVVGLWNLHWLPLVVAFIDWDVHVRTPITEWVPPRFAVRAFIACFLALDVVTSFVPGLDQRLGLYPFSSFPMFASVRVTRPYGTHQPYVVAGDQYEVIADHPVDADQQRWFDYQHRGLSTDRARLQTLLATARARYPDRGIHAIRHWLTIFEAPAYPAPARFVAHRIALIGEVRDNATMIDHLGERGYIYYRGDRAKAVAPDAEPDFVVTIVDGLPWLAAVVRHGSAVMRSQ